MAQLFPNLNACLPKMTTGEKKLAHIFNQLLEDDYLCWYDVPLGPKYHHPDFVILNPRRGLLLLEVKDWKLSTLESIDRSSARLITHSGLKTVANPLEQARQYIQSVVNLLEKDAILVNQKGFYQGKLCFPWGYGAVLSNITRAELEEQSNLHLAIDPNKVICKDELVLDQDAEQFQNKLWNMFTVGFSHTMSLPEIDRVRWHLFPEIRLNGQMSLLEAPDTQTLSEAIPEVIRVMDLQQEQIARNIGKGHRVIHGVAGSGKTMILAHRCSQLAQKVDKPILVLCFNKSLAEYLRNLLNERGIASKVQIYHFHKWCKEQGLMYQLNLPKFNFGKKEQYQKDLVQAVVDGIDNKQVPAGQYSAILIDEGNDFEPDWFRLIVKMVDPETKSLLVLYDDAQTVYKRKKFTFSSVGIQARGRTTILKLNYRNTEEILQFAKGFLEQWITPKETEEDEIPLLSAQTTGRHGVKPNFVFCASEEKEIPQVIAFLRLQYQRLKSWKQLAVLFYSNAQCDSFFELIKKHDNLGIPITRVNPKKEQYDLDKDTVKIMTIHSSKGLEFDSVALPNIKLHQRSSVEEEAKLLYVGMTRAMNNLLVTSHEKSIFSDVFNQVK